MFTNRYYTRHVIKTAQNATPKPRVQSLKKFGTEGLLKDFASVCKSTLKPAVLQCIEHNFIIRFALPKSQPRLFNVQSRVIAVRVP